MPFNDDLPAENTDPWYGPLVAAWSNLKTFINGLETAVGSAASAASQAQATADQAIPSSQVVHAIGTRGVFEGYVLNANDVTPGGVQPYDLIVRKTA